MRRTNSMLALLLASLLSFPAGSRAEDADSATSGTQTQDEQGLVRPARKPRRPSAARPEADNDAAPAKPREGQYGSRRIQVILLPIGDSTASLAAGPAQAALEGETAKMPGYHPVDLVQELAAPPSASAVAKLEEARRAIKEGAAQMDSQQYSEAANRYQHAAELMEQAFPATDSKEYAETFVRVGLAHQFAGEDDAAKQAFRTAARLDLAKTVDGRNVDKDLGNALDRARDAVAQGPIGTLSIVTNPPGARVFIGGKFRGVAPITVDKLPAGINLVKVDRPGAYPVEQLVEVKQAQDIAVRIQTHFTDEAREMQLTISQIPDALDHEKGVPDMVKAVGKRFRLERAVIATVRMNRTNVAEVRAAVFDLPRDVRLADERALFALDSETGLQADIAKWARGVIDRADKVRDRSAKDPLSRGDGTEDWYSTENNRRKEQASAASDRKDDPNAPEWERSNYQPTQTKKKNKKSKDPLDHTDGTEEW